MENLLKNGVEARTFLLQKFEDVLTTLCPSRVYFVAPAPITAPPARNYPQTRLEIPLSGEKKVTIATDGEIRTIRIRPGEMLYSEKNRCAISHWDVPHDMLSIAFANGNDYIRFLHVNCDGTTQQVSADVWYHTASGLSGAGIHLIQALNLLARHEQSGQRPESPEILMALTRMAVGVLRQDRPELQSKAQRTFINARQYLIEHCCQDGISRKKVAAVLKINPAYLSRLFKRFTDQNFNDILVEQRLIRAEQMLADQALSVNEIATECGFADTGYFIRLFKRHFGSTPGKYRPARS